MATVPQLNAIVIRDTADKVAVAERLIEVNDKAKAEVVLDVELLQLSTTKLLDLGATLSSYDLGSRPVHARPTTRRERTIAGRSRWKDLLKLSLSDFNFTIPSITVNFLKSNTDTETPRQAAAPDRRGGEGDSSSSATASRSR